MATVGMRLRNAQDAVFRSGYNGSATEILVGNEVIRNFWNRLECRQVLSSIRLRTHVALGFCELLRLYWAAQAWKTPLAAKIAGSADCQGRPSGRTKEVTVLSPAGSGVS